MGVESLPGAWAQFTPLHVHWGRSSHLQRFRLHSPTKQWPPQQPQAHSSLFPEESRQGQPHIWIFLFAFQALPKGHWLARERITHGWPRERRRLGILFWETPAAVSSHGYIVDILEIHWLKSFNLQVNPRAAPGIMRASPHAGYDVRWADVG